MLGVLSDDVVGPCCGGTLVDSVVIFVVGDFQFASWQDSDADGFEKAQKLVYALRVKVLKSAIRKDSVVFGQDDIGNARQNLVINKKIKTLGVWAMGLRTAETRTLVSNTTRIISRGVYWSYGTHVGRRIQWH